MEIGEHVPIHAILIVKERQFVCDRSLLASHSPYFHAMFNNNFKEKHQENIELKGVEPDAFDYINNVVSGKPADFTKCQNILDVLEASCMLQFELIKNDCIKFIIQSWLDMETWLPTANTADKLGLTELKYKTKTLALWNFSDVRKTEHFLYLSPEEVIDYLSDDRLRTTVGEFEVFEAGVNWIEFNLEERLFYSLQLLKIVRFKNMHSFDVRNMLHFSSVKDTPQAELIIECILEIKDGVLNQSCESCNSTMNEDQDSLESGKSSPLPTGAFFKNLKRKRKTTSHCTCFDSTTVKTAQELLEKEDRSLPLIPCVAASLPFNEPVSIGTPCQTFRKKNKWPYMFKWNGVQLVPYIHLSKIDEGPAEALGYKVVIKDLNLYVIGGEYMMGQGDWNTSIWFYDTWRETWQFETSLPTPRRHHSAVCINNDIYIIGGVGRHRVMLDSVAKYNLISKCWESCAPLPIALYSTACCVYKDDIYLFGSQLFCYRHAVASWEVISQLSLPGNMAVSVAMTDGGVIYIIGIDAKLYSFVPQPTDIEVEFIGQFKIPGNNACLVNDSIYYFGEEDDVQSVEVFNLKTKTFRTAWSDERDRDNEPAAYCMKQAAGCFPLPKYY